MSDLDDLQRLQQMLDEGKITEEEYAHERAWITGSAAEDIPAGKAPSAAANKKEASTARGHVIDLHEIEEREEQPERTPKRRKLPAVWKAILIAFVIWILLLATAVIYLRIRSAGVQTTESAQTVSQTQTQQGSETAQSAADELQGSTEETSYEAFTAQLEQTLSTYYGDNYSITDDGKTLTISLTGEGIAADAMYVVDGVDGAAAVWETLKASMQSLALTCFDGANADAPERHVVLNILNDQNAENVILSYLDGSCIYDATEQ